MLLKICDMYSWIPLYYQYFLSGDCAFRAISAAVKAAQLLCFEGSFADNIARSSLGFHIDFSDVLANYAQRNQLHACDEADDAGHAGPAGNGISDAGLDNGPDHADKAQQCYKNTKAGNHAKGLDRQACNPVKGQRQHLGQGVMALTCYSLVALIGNAGTLKANQWYHAAEEQIHFLKVCKFLQHSGAHQAIVCMVENHLGPHGIQQLVEALCREALEERVGIPFAADTVNHLAAVQIGIHHGIHCIDIVLSVAVDGNGDITAVLGLHQSRQNGIPQHPLVRAGFPAKLAHRHCIPDNHPNPET